MVSQAMRTWLVGSLLALAANCSLAQPHESEAVPFSAEPEPGAPESTPEAEIGRGMASWYGPRFHGRRTASGERFDMEALTAAHRTLPFGTVVRVRSMVNGRTVDVLINDRGPYLKRRVIDLSQAAARALGLLESGTGTKPVVLSLVPMIAGEQKPWP
jgi:rare lipoprotein A